MRLAPRAIFRSIERYIILAGKQDVWKINKVILVWGTVIVGAFLLGIIFFIKTDLLLIQRLAMLFILVAMGISFPLSYIKSIIKQRQEKIANQLPPFLDLLSVSVQAGLSFDASIERILRRSTGELMDEFKQMQKDMRELHQQRIKAKALKAPIKILFPLILFIFPTIFIIILLPPLINILNNMHILP